MQQRFFVLQGFHDQYILVDPEHPLHGMTFVRVPYPMADKDGYGLTMPEMLCPTGDRVPDEPLANIIGRLPTLGPEYHTDCMCSCKDHYEARTNYPH